MRTASCRRGASTRRGAPSPASGTRRSRARSTCRSGRRRCRRPAAPKRRAGCAAAGGAADRPAGLARALTHAPCCARAVSRAKIRRKTPIRRSCAKHERRRVPGGEARLRQRPPGNSRASVFVAPATFRVPHLVQPAFLLLGFASHPLALLDQLADLLPALVTDLGVELRTACGPDRLAALLADLLVELVPALRLDGLAALLADLLVERPAPLRLHRLAALAADLLVEGMPVFVAHRLAALAACLRPPHRALLLARALVRHSRPPHTPRSGANLLRPRRDVPRREPCSALRPAAIRSRTRCPPSLPISW